MLQGTASRGDKVGQNKRERLVQDAKRDRKSQKLTAFFAPVRAPTVGTPVAQEPTADNLARAVAAAASVGAERVEVTTTTTTTVHLRAPSAPSTTAVDPVDSEDPQRIASAQVPPALQGAPRLPEPGAPDVATTARLRAR
jgi:hypothetical protein